MNEEYIDKIDNLNDAIAIVEENFKKYTDYNSKGHAIGMNLDEIKRLIKDGKLINCIENPDLVCVEGGRDGFCHQEALKLWLDKNKIGIKLVDGYALNNGIWAKHAWCSDSQGIVHECTSIKRQLYYGYILNEKESELFHRKWDYEYDAKCKKNERRENQTVDIEDYDER